MNRRDTLLALVASAAAAGSRAPLAQQPSKIWHVGYLSLSSISLGSLDIQALLKGMRQLGYVEG